MSSSFAKDVLLGSKQLSNYALWVAHYTEAVSLRCQSPGQPGPSGSTQIEDEWKG